MTRKKYCGTAAKAGGNGENKPRPKVMGVPCLLEIHTLGRLGFQLLLTVLLTAPCATCHAAELPEIAAIPLARAHAHNDYHHDRPLWDALAHGFCSVEADIYLVEGQLLVGHGRHELKPERTLQSLYLQPLHQLVRKHEGRVYPNGPVVTLLIDIKSEGTSTFEALHQVLAQYGDMLTHVDGERVKPGAVSVIISGNRAHEVITGVSPRYAGIDGRMSDLGTKLPAHLMPLISDNWSNHFRWRGDGPMPAEERQKLREFVEKAHNANRRVRLWATPENRAVWEVLFDSGIDMINTDDLAGLQKFLMGRAETSQTH